MTDLLLDTHALVWFEYGNPRLSRGARDALETPEGRRVISIATIWEMALLLAKGRLPVVATLFPDAASRLRAKNYEIVGIESWLIERSTRLPPHHNDPFDRLLVATAEFEATHIVTTDRSIPLYGVPCIW